MSRSFTKQKQDQFPLPTILHQKTIIRDPTQNASEADFHHFLRTRKDIEMVQTKHCESQTKDYDGWFEPS